jgi:hypothetical protein
MTWRSSRQVFRPSYARDPDGSLRAASSVAAVVVGPDGPVRALSSGITAQQSDDRSGGVSSGRQVPLMLDIPNRYDGRALDGPRVPSDRPVIPVGETKRWRVAAT